MGQQAPEFEVTKADGTVVGLTDLDGNPVRLEDLRGKLVWLNFWATWCPPCQSETPVLRDMDEAYGDKGLAIVGIAVQETTPDDVQAYADRYELGYDIAFDASADIFNLYKVFALPTQFFIGPDGPDPRGRQRAAHRRRRAGADGRLAAPGGVAAGADGRAACRSRPDASSSLRRPDDGRADEESPRCAT